MLNQRGAALPIALIILTLLTSLTLALTSLSAFEPMMSGNLADTTQARYAAEAGIEWAFNTLGGANDWDPLLAGATVNGVTMVANQPLPSLPASRGTFTVLLRNDTLATDPQITGTTPKDDKVDVDDNNTVIITAFGQKGDAVKALQVTVRRPIPPPFPGALSFPGLESEVKFDGNSFEISGHGYKMDGSSDASCQSEYGIAVSKVLPSNDPGANEQVVESALTSSQRDNIKGRKEDPAGVDYGNNTIEADDRLTPEAIKAFIDQAKQAADIVLESKQPDGLEFDSIGSTCATDPNSQTCWGTPDNPKIIYIKGEPDPTSAFAALQISGTTTGTGILIVEDGDLRISGNFNWNGPIIVTGNYVGVGFLGGGWQTVYGAVISNETSNDPGFKEGVATGNAKIRYSCEALALALNTKKLTTASNWREIAP